MSSWLLLQLTDSAFPSGGFAHSAGLEAALVLGGIPGGQLAPFLDASLRQAGRTSLPFVRAAALAPSSFRALDDACDGALPMAAVNRASRAQGRALASSAARIWEELVPVAERARSGFAHHPVVFGAVFGTLGVSKEDTAMAWLHGIARGILSAGVRLGMHGPLEAQRLLSAQATVLDAILEAPPTRIEGVAHTAPLLEVYAALHDRLDGRMFQS